MRTFSRSTATGKRRSSGGSYGSSLDVLSTATRAAGAAPRVPFFRFPGFADTPETLAWLDAHGVAVFGADLWASDWLTQTPEAQLELTMHRLAATRGGILLIYF